MVGYDGGPGQASAHQLNRRAKWAPFKGALGGLILGLVIGSYIWGNWIRRAGTAPPWPIPIVLGPGAMTIIGYLLGR